MRFLVITAALAVLGVGCGAPTRNPTPVPPAFSRTAAVLQSGGASAADAMRACVVDALHQGLSVQQATDICALELAYAGVPGLSPDPSFGGVLPMPPAAFDPNGVQIACASPDPTRAGAKDPVQGPDVGLYGNYTWGGDKDAYYGYSQEESRRLKDEAIQAAKAAADAFDKAEKAAEEAVTEAGKADKAAEADPGNKAKQDAAKAADAAAKKALDDAQTKLKASDEATNNANADPNKKPSPNVGRGVNGEESTCAQELEDAREFLRECNRTDWKSAACQAVRAKAHNCPDPTLILVDPDAGYVCAASVDAKALADAYRRQCEAVTRPVAGEDPCVPPVVSADGRSAKSPTDLCNSPIANVDPGSGMCWTKLDLGSFGRVNLNQIVLIGLQRLGGPILVIPGSVGPRGNPHADTSGRGGPGGE